MSTCLLGHDVNVDRGGIPQELVDCGKVEVFLPALHSRSSEDHLRDVLVANHLGDFFCDILPFDFDDLRTEILREPDIFLESTLILRGVVHADIDIEHEQLGIDSRRHAAGPRHQVLRRRIRTDAHAKLLRQRCALLEVFLLEIRFQAPVDDVADLLQSDLTQRNQISGTKEVRQCALRAFDGINIAAFHAVLQRFGSQVGEDDLVDTFHDPVRNRLAHDNAGDARHQRRDTLDVLNVHGRDDVDICIEYLDDVLIPLAMLAPIDIRMGEFVDQDDPRLSRKNCVDVHLFEERSLVFERLPRDLLESRYKFLDTGAPVGFHYADDDVLATAMAANAFAQHVVGLADSGRIAQKDLEQAPALFRRGLLQPLFRGLLHFAYSPQTPATCRIDYNHPRNPMLQRPVVRYAVALLAVAAIAAIYTKLIRLNPTAVGFTFLLAVLIISAAWGLRYAIFLSVAATLAYNFFFLPPVGTFNIADPQNWVALISFLITAVIGSQLAERARREAESASRRQKELERLYSFSQQMLATENVLVLVNNIPRDVVQTMGVAAAGMYVMERKKFYFSDIRAKDVISEEDLQRVADRSEPFSDHERKLGIVPLRVGVRSVGALGIAGAEIARETLDATATLIAIAIERAGAVEQLAHTEANRESERLRSILLDSVTHDFRTPLTSIKASAESLLGDSGLDDAARRELLTVINEESDRLDRLVGEAAEMAQLDSGALELHLEPHHIQEAIEAAVASTKNALLRHPLKVIADRSLPTVRIDVARISEVIAQLLDNAAKYSPEGTQITISAEVKQGKIVTSVADHGPGIDGLDQAMIFEKFYRGRGQRATIQGTGMGLPIAKALVEAHGGVISVVSQLERGSVFSFALPILGK